MPIKVITTGYGAAALDALRVAVARVKAADPMAPVTVLAPNNLAGITARRYLARGADGRAGIAGIEVSTVSRLAERIAVPLLAPRRPATRTVLAAAWRRALADEPRCFRDIARHPVTVRALVHAHTELRDVSAGAREAIKNTTPVARDLVELHETVTARLSSDWYDRTDVLTVAAKNVPALGSCFLYAPQDLTQAEARFVKAVAQQADVTVLAALTGVRRADAAIHQTLLRLGASTDESVAIRTASRVINASDSDDEVRCVVRDLMQTLRGVPAHRVAVLYTAPAPYARLLHEQLGAAGVTVNGAGVRSVADRAVARVLRDALALVDGDVPRADLFRALAHAPTRDFTGERIPIARWERLSRSAGVVGGDDWASRLDVRIADLQEEAVRAAAGEEPLRWLAERHQRDAAAAAELRAFATRLRDELRAAALMTTWRQLAGWALDLFGTLIGDDEALRTLPPEEQYAAVTVTSLLRGLSALDAVEQSAGFDALRDVLDAELEATLPRVGRFGDGVLVAPVDAAVGLDMDVVYVVGLSEDLYPGRLAADALLPERARGAAGGELPAHRERLHAKYRNLLAAFGCAAQVVASFPRGDLRRSSRRLPSPFLLPSLRELADDHTLAATAWDSAEYGAAMDTADSYAGELLRTDRLSTEQEWRIRQAAVQQLDDDVVREAVAMIRGRSGSQFTRYDGNLAGVDGLPDYAVGERAISPTALESFATCPHAYFVERLLGVKPLEQPEDVVTIAPIDIGNLIHESVDALITEFAGSLPGPGQPWSDVQRRRLVAIATDKAEQFRRRGLTGHPRLWEGERIRLLRDVEWLISDDDRWRSERDARVLASELPFGSNGVPPVEIPVPGGRVRMRGSADKVDQAADGTIIVTDIKTGSDSSYLGITQDDPTAGGSKLQLPVYAYAARERFGRASSPVEAEYWFVRKSRGRRIAVELDSELEQAYARTLAVLVRSIAAGLFPARTPDGPDYGTRVWCEYCNPDGVGYGDGRDRWERKRSDPVLRDYVALVEPEAGDQP
ncbi:MAG TPA: PD-(D/E)XK nuclease family protein [Jatrophihabitans sp.]|nr:PD-(D/E)XK nuclease family protein [Jatrophihabitans sp.]